MCVAIAVLLAFLTLPNSSCIADNLALLAGTLKTMQRAACDDEVVALACPRGTSISIQVAQYGNARPDGCVPEKNNVEVVGEEKCLWPNSMQYSLLQTVVEACQKKPQCKFNTKPKQNIIDPCPLAKKFVEVAYKCRPYEFRSRTGCEDDVIKLSCNPHSRVAIFEAKFGRTALEAVSCPQTPKVRDESTLSCQAPHATERAMELCHGKRRCQLPANRYTFTTATRCNFNSSLYLTVIYACVPLGVLLERFESPSEKDEILDDRNDLNREQDLFDESEDPGEKWGETNVPPIANPALQPLPQDFPRVDEKPSSINKPKVILHEIPPSQTKSKLIFIYVGVGVCIFLFLVLISLGIRCYVSRRSTRISKTDDLFTTDAPNVFNDAVSDVDNDIDVSHISGTFYDPLHPDMILYRDVPGSKGTLRAMRPLSTIYPCAGASMYGNVDYVPPQAREVPPCPGRFSRGNSKEERVDPDITMSPKSLGYNSQYYYG